MKAKPETENMESSAFSGKPEKPKKNGFKRIGVRFNFAIDQHGDGKKPTFWDWLTVITVTGAGAMLFRLVFPRLMEWLQQ